MLFICEITVSLFADMHEEMDDSLSNAYRYSPDKLRFELYNRDAYISANDDKKQTGKSLRDRTARRRG